MHPPVSVRRAAALAAALLMGACSDSPTPPPPPPVLTSVAVTPATAELRAVGDSVRLTAAARDQNGAPMAGHAFEWTSTDTTLATVDAAGLVRARASGSVTITAVTGGKSATADVALALRQTVTVQPGGGDLQVGGAGRVTVPAGAFAAPQAVTVEVTRAQEVEVDYAVTGEAYRAGPRLANEVRVRIGTTAPLDSLGVELEVPAAFAAALPSSHRPQLFVEILQSEGEEVLDDFVPVAATYDAATRRLRGALPPEAFTHWRRTDEAMEAIVLVGSVPVAPPSQAGRAMNSPPAIVREPDGGWLNAEASPCPNDALSAPLDGDLHVTGKYASPGHKGVDLRAEKPTPVYAGRDGVVEKIGFDERPLPKPDPRSGKKIKGWGRYVRIRHADKSSTVYAHLTKESTDNLKEGSRVSAGDQLALSGNTGGSSAPHLHVEYVRPDGTHFDPASCIVAGIVIDPGSKTLGTAQSARLTARVTAVGGTDLSARAVVAWSSSDAQVATVDASGVVRANGEGRTGTTQVRAALGRAQATAPVTVHGLAGRWAGTWTNVVGGNSGGMTLSVDVAGQTATGTLTYSRGGAVYFQRTYQAAATATTLRISLALGGGSSEEVNLALSGARLTGTIVDTHPLDTVRFTAVLDRVADGASLVAPPVTSPVEGPQPGSRPPR